MNAALANRATAGPDPRPDDVTRVMLVDDSAVIRRVVGRVLADEHGVEVVGTASNGQEALERIESFRPHVVVLDVEMPVLDGLATLKQLRPRWPGLPVIMFSTLTSRAASATLDALSSGASDYATKPVSQGSLNETIEAVRTQLVPLVRSWGAIGRRRDVTSRRPPASDRPARPAAPAPAGGPGPGPAASPRIAPAPAPAVGRRTVATRPVEAVVIGSSAGGPNALAELIPQFPAELSVPMLLTQHMPETFTQLLAKRLNDKSRITVVEGDAGMTVEPGHLYVARGGLHMVVARRAGRVVIEFDEGPPENYCRPAVDVMFRSAARLWGPALLGVVLTGMGRDGVNGARAITEGGGTVITQDESSCLVWGMPGAVFEAGLSAESVPLDRIAPNVCKRLGLAGGEHL